MVKRRGTSATEPAAATGAEEGFSGFAIDVAALDGIEPARGVFVRPGAAERFGGGGSQVLASARHDPLRARQRCECHAARPVRRRPAVVRVRRTGPGWRLRTVQQAPPCRKGSRELPPRCPALRIRTGRGSRRLRWRARLPGRLPAESVERSPGRGEERCRWRIGSWLRSPSATGRTAAATTPSSTRMAQMRSGGNAGRPMASFTAARRTSSRVPAHGLAGAASDLEHGIGERDAGGTRRGLGMNPRQGVGRGLASPDFLALQARDEDVELVVTGELRDDLEKFVGHRTPRGRATSWR